MCAELGRDLTILYDPKQEDDFVRASRRKVDAPSQIVHRGPFIFLMLRYGTFAAAFLSSATGPLGRVEPWRVQRMMQEFYFKFPQLYHAHTPGGKRKLWIRDNKGA